MRGNGVDAPLSLLSGVSPRIAPLTRASQKEDSSGTDMRRRVGGGQVTSL